MGYNDRLVCHKVVTLLLLIAIAMFCYVIQDLLDGTSFNQKFQQPPHVVHHNINRVPSPDQFARVGEGTSYPWYVISAYYDQRSFAGSVIVLGLVPSTMPKDTSYWCVIYNQDTVITERTLMEWYWWKEPRVPEVPQDQLWHQAFGKCLMATPVATHVSIVSSTSAASGETQRALQIPLHVVRGVAQGGTLGLCLSPMFNMGDEDISRWVEFMELQLLLGVNKVLLYDLYDCSPAFREAVSYYVSRGVLEVVPWQIPMWAVGKGDHFIRGSRTGENNSSFIKYFGQYLLDTDCLYRFMDHFEYLLYIDIDEAVVPITEQTLPALLSKRRFIDRRRLASYSFKGTVICDALQTDSETGTHRVTHTYTVNDNSTGEYSDHIKYVVFTGGVIQLWTHGITQARRGLLFSWSVPIDVARKLHFREQRPCSENTHEVNITERYQEELVHRIRCTLQQLRTHSKDPAWQETLPRKQGIFSNG